MRDLWRTLGGGALGLLGRASFITAALLAAAGVITAALLAIALLALAAKISIWVLLGLFAGTF